MFLRAEDKETIIAFYMDSKGGEWTKTTVHSTIGPQLDTILDYTYNERTVDALFVDQSPN